MCELFRIPHRLIRYEPLQVSGCSIVLSFVCGQSFSEHVIVDLLGIALDTVVVGYPATISQWFRANIVFVFLQILQSFVGSGDNSKSSLASESARWLALLTLPIPQFFQCFGVSKF